MQWGFVALTQDNGDGDGTFGMDEFLHQTDWAGLSASYTSLTGQYR